MVDADQGEVAGEGDRLGRRQPHQQRADQAGAAGHGDSLDRRQLDAGAGQRLLHHHRDRLDVPARSQLGDHPTVAGMDVDLGGDDVGENPAPVADDGGSCLIAGRFDAE